MTDTDLRIALAEALGWENVWCNARGVIVGRIPGVFTLRELRVPNWIERPDELERLESSLRCYGLRDDYLMNLAAQVGVAFDRSGDSLFKLVHASARQRCIAALKTLQDSAGVGANFGRKIALSALGVPNP
jgi:hypothetical protein